jgi:hypothetical protein
MTRKFEVSCPVALGDVVQLPEGFSPSYSAPIPLDSPRCECPPCNGDCCQGDECPAWEPVPARDLIGPVLLLVVLTVALASCAFLGWRA